jgi:WD40 repeat protein
VLVLKGQAALRCLSYSPDGAVLAAGDEGGRIRLWSLPAGKEIAVLDRDNGPVEAIAFAPSADQLIAGLPDSINLWDVKTHQLIAEAPGHHNGTRGLAWHPDGKSFASCGWDRELRIWPIPFQKNTHHIAVPEPMMALCFLAKGKRLVAAGGNGSLVLIEPEKNALTPLVKHERGFFSLACSPNGKLLAAGDAKGDIILQAPTVRSKARVLQAHEWTVYSLGFTPDGQSLLSGGADGTVRLWAVATGRLVETFRWHSSSVSCVAIAPDGMTAAAGSADGSLVVWDLADV